METTPALCTKRGQSRAALLSPAGPWFRRQAGSAWSRTGGNTPINDPSGYCQGRWGTRRARSSWARPYPPARAEMRIKFKVGLQPAPFSDRIIFVLGTATAVLLNTLTGSAILSASLWPPPIVWGGGPLPGKQGVKRKGGPQGPPFQRIQKSGSISANRIRRPDSAPS